LLCRAGFADVSRNLKIELQGFAGIDGSELAAAVCSLRIASDGSIRSCALAASFLRCVDTVTAI